MITRRSALTALAALSIAGVAAGPALATGRPAAPEGSAGPPGPTSIQLPSGFRPEGIDIGPGHVAYLGSLGGGQLLRADLRTGDTEVFSGAVGSPAVGLESDDRGRLFVSGGASGTARVVDTVTGEVLASYQLAAQGTPSFINDVVVTDSAAWFTDSTNAVLYQVPLGRFGQLPAQSAVEVLPLTGDIEYSDELADFEANGIETTPDGSALLIDQSRTGLLFHVDPVTGVSTQVYLRGEVLESADGLVREGDVLYVVEYLIDEVAVVELDDDGRRGKVVRRLSDPALDVPTTVAVLGDRLYLPNARLGIESPDTAEFEVVTIPRP